MQGETSGHLLLPSVPVPLRQLVLVLGLLAGCATPLAACSCAEEDAATAFRRAREVFSGRLVSMRLTTDQPNTEMRFRVERYWKGGRAREITVLSGTDGPCDVSYRLGGRYLVYADPTPEGIVGGGFCSRTRLLRNATADLATFGRGWTPRRWRILPIGLLLGISAALAAFTLLRGQFRRG